MPASPDPSYLPRPYVGGIVHVRDWDGYCLPAVILCVYRDERDLPLRLRLRVMRPTPLGAVAGSADDEYPMAEPGQGLGEWHSPERPSSSDERTDPVAFPEPEPPDFDLGPEVDDEGGMSEHRPFAPASYRYPDGPEA